LHLYMCADWAFVSGQGESGAFEKSEANSHLAIDLPLEESL